MSWSTSELRVRLAPLNRFKPSSKIFYWPFQGGTSFVDLFMFLFWLVFAMSVRVCLYVLCGHLLGKGWPLGSRLWCLLWVCHFPIGILGQVWYLIVSIPDLCTFTYFQVFDLIYFFWKMPYYTYFFFLKFHLCVIIQKFSLTHSEREDLIDYRINFSVSTLQNISFFLFLIPKVSLFILNYCHSYYPADLVWNFIFFLTSHCDSFCTWKNPTIPTFLHQ